MQDLQKSDIYASFKLKENGSYTAYTGMLWVKKCATLLLPTTECVFSDKLDLQVGHAQNFLKNIPCIQYKLELSYI